MFTVDQATNGSRNTDILFTLCQPSYINWAPHISSTTSSTGYNCSQTSNIWKLINGKSWKFQTQTREHSVRCIPAPFHMSVI